MFPNRPNWQIVLIVKETQKRCLAAGNKTEEEWVGEWKYRNCEVLKDKQGKEDRE